MLGKLLQGRYRIVQVLSAGGFCQTYLAQDTGLTNHPTCVVKHLLRTSDEPESIQTLRHLFTREAEALNKLGNYDRVPQLLAHFEENLEFYLVQEFILGHTLSVELQTGKRWSEGAVIQLLQEALSILAYVHSHGLIHRDIKPNNLIRRQQDGKLVLIDFGSVKQAWTQVVTSQGKTSTSYAVGIPATIAIGTPGYMPSEQARGRPRPASDIYGLGIIGIQALTGLNPTQLLEDSDTGEIIWQHHVKVSGALANVLTKMVRYHFQERYESATEALQALEPLINRHLPRQAAIGINPQRPRQEKVIGRSPTAILAPEKATKQVTLPDLKDKRAIPPLEDRTSDDFPRLPQKSPLLIGIATSFAAVLALTAGSYYFLRSPDSVAVKTPVAIKSQNLVGSENPLKMTFTGHSEGVWSVALSWDGKTLVSGSADKTIKVWDLETRQLIRTLSGHSDSVRSVAINFDRQILASGSGDNNIKLWNVQTGAQINTLSGHTGPVWSVAISPDGQTLVSGSEDTNIKVWDLPSGKLRSTLADHSSRVFSVAISLDGQTLATAGSDQSIRIWNLQTGNLRRTLKGHSDAVRSVTFSPDGQTLASGSWDKTVKVWNLQTGEVIRTFTGHSDRVVSVTFSNDSQTLVSAGIDRTIKIWNLQTGKLRRNLTGHFDWVLSIATSPIGQTVVSGSKDKTIKIWQF